MPPRPLNWGILSTARINRALIPILSASPRTRLLAVASRSLSSAEEYARQWHIPRAYGRYEELLADAEIDVIYNPLPNHLHAEWTIKAVQAGKHVLCEKPLALSLNEVEAIQAAAQAHAKIVTEAFMYRHHPQTLKVKEIITSGILGPLRLIRGAFTFTLNRPGNFRFDPAMGGGSIWDVGCYPISYTRFLLGAEPLEVFGWQARGPAGSDETFVGQMRFPGEVFAQFESSFVASFHTFMQIIGSEGRLEIPLPFKPGYNNQIYLTRGEQTESIEIAGQELYLGEVEDLCDAILEGKPPRISLAESRGNIATILALLESAQSNRPIALSSYFTP